MKKFLFSLLLLTTVSFAHAQSQPAPPTPPPPPPANDSLLVEFTGKFKFPDGNVISELTMVVENGTLTAQSAMGNAEFKKTDNKDVFEIIAYGGTATYKRNGQGKITGLRIQVQDLDMEGVKQ